MIDYCLGKTDNISIQWCGKIQGWTECLEGDFPTSSCQLSATKDGTEYK